MAIFMNDAPTAEKFYFFENNACIAYAIGHVLRVERQGSPTEMPPGLMGFS